METKGITYKTSNSIMIVDNGNFKMVENLDSSELLIEILLNGKIMLMKMEIFFKHPELMPQVL